MARSKSDSITVDKLLQDLQTVVDDAEALLKATANQAGEKVQEARARATQSLGAARERLAEMQHGAMRQAQEAIQSGDEYVHSHPWQAVGIAAGVGLLIGLLLRRD